MEYLCSGWRSSSTSWPIEIARKRSCSRPMPLLRAGPARHARRRTEILTTTAPRSKRRWRAFWAGRPPTQSARTTVPRRRSAVNVRRSCSRRGPSNLGAVTGASPRIRSLSGDWSQHLCGAFGRRGLTLCRTTRALRFDLTGQNCTILDDETAARYVTFHRSALAYLDSVVRCKCSKHGSKDHDTFCLDVSTNGGVRSNGEDVIG